MDPTEGECWKQKTYCTSNSLSHDRSMSLWTVLHFGFSYLPHHPVSCTFLFIKQTKPFIPASFVCVWVLLLPVSLLIDMTISVWWIRKQLQTATTTTQEKSDDWNCYLISIDRSVCKIDFELQNISTIIPPATFTAFAPFFLFPDDFPLITITLSTQDFPCTTPATLCDDVNHPTITVPIWQLPTL